MSEPVNPTRLYLITPPQLADVAGFAHTLRDALSAGDVACLQLRLKNTGDEALIAATETLMPVCHAFDVAFILNDRPDLAKTLGCDGVHLGEEDTAYETARHMVGPGAIVGVSCYDSRHRAMELAEAGADYVAFGAFYPTGTKIAKTRAEPEILEKWTVSTTVPCVAIGGITPENAGPLITAGADFLAVSAGVWTHPNGAAAAIRCFNEVIGKQVVRVG